MNKVKNGDKGFWPDGDAFRCVDGEFRCCLGIFFGEVQSGASFGLSPVGRHRGFIQREEIRQY